MQLKKIQAQVEHLKKYLQSPHCYDHLYWWESQQVFQKQWDILAEDFGKMYDMSLQNSHTKRLWKREQHYPKKLFLLFIQQESDFVKQMFRDLFNEDKSIDGRVDRFVFYADEMLQLYKKANPRSIENNHYHSYEVCSMYLAFRYPAIYGFYNLEQFQHCLTCLGSPNIPQVDDFARFCKVSKTLWNFLSKDEAIFDLHQKRLEDGKHYMGDSMLLVSEWMYLMQE